MEQPRTSAARETINEGAAEVKAKLKEDLSRWSRARRFVSLKPEIPCLECDGAGKILCAACQGSGFSRLVMEDGTQDACIKCGGARSVTCIVCAGKGVVQNAYRKPMLWLLAVGGLAWLLIFFQLWGRDVLPEQRARILQRGERGNSVVAPAPSASLGGRGSVAPGSAPMPAAPTQGGAPPQQQGYGAPQPPITAAPGQQGGAHGNAVQPGYGGGPAQGWRVPPGRNAGPYGGGNSIPSPR